MSLGTGRTWLTTSRIAGGETVSTFLGAATYYLTRNSDCYRKLANEIRHRWTKYEEIDASSAQALPYLQAVISEGLRIYPPGSQGFPRVSPGAFIDERWVPAGVSYATKPARDSPLNLD